jgi:hypothetical protein
MSTRIKFVLLAVLSLLMTTLVLNPMSNASAAGENDTFSWYGAVYQKSPTAASQQQTVHGWRGDHLNGLINQQIDQNGYHLTEIQGYYVPNGGADPIRYDAVLDKGVKEQKFALSVTHSEFKSLNASFAQQGLNVVFIRSHLVGNFLRFSVIWEKKATGFMMAVTREQVIARDEWMRDAGFNMIHIDVYAWIDGQNHYNVVWEENAPATGWFWNYTWSDLMTLRNQQAAAGWEQIQIHAYDIDHTAGVNERYDILLRPTQTYNPRTFEYTYSFNAQLDKVNAKRAEGFRILSQQRVTNVIR